MSALPECPSLKEIYAYKKKLNWGDVPPIFHLASSSIGDIDNILTHGFDSAYKRVLDQTNWNLSLLEGYQDPQGNICVKQKPQIFLQQVFDDQHYRLQCYPMMDGEKLYTSLINNPKCPFNHWVPEKMSMLFRINNIIPFIVFTFQSGDKADFELIKYAHRRVDELINELKISFDVVGMKGFSIAEFCKELYRRKPHFHLDNLIDNATEHTGN